MALDTDRDETCGCGHEAGEHAESGCYAERGEGFPPGDICPCPIAQASIYRLALAERDAQLAEARRERDEARRTLRTELAGYDRMACELGTCKKQHDALAAQLRDADAVIDALARHVSEEKPTTAFYMLVKWRERTVSAPWRVK